MNELEALGDVFDEVQNRVVEDMRRLGESEQAWEGAVLVASMIRDILTVVVENTLNDPDADDDLFEKGSRFAMVSVAALSRAVLSHPGAVALARKKGGRHGPEQR